MLKRFIVVLVVVLLAVSTIMMPTEAKEKKQKRYINKCYRIKQITYEEAGYNDKRYADMCSTLSKAKASYKFAKKWLKENKENRDDPYVKPLYKKIKKVKRMEKDVNLLAHLIYAENGTEGYKCMYNTGSVVLNRKRHKHYPDMIHDVIYQEGQYAVTFDGAIDKEPSKEAYDIARDLIFNGTTVPKDVVYQAEFYQGSGVYEQIDETYFCYW